MDHLKNTDFSKGMDTDAVPTLFQIEDSMCGDNDDSIDQLNNKPHHIPSADQVAIYTIHYAQNLLSVPCSNHPFSLVHSFDPLNMDQVEKYIKDNQKYHSAVSDRLRSAWLHLTSMNPWTINNTTINNTTLNNNPTNNTPLNNERWNVVHSASPDMGQFFIYSQLHPYTGFTYSLQFPLLNKHATLSMLHLLSAPATDVNMKWAMTHCQTTLDTSLQFSAQTLLAGNELDHLNHSHHTNIAIRDQKQGTYPVVVLSQPVSPLWVNKLLTCVMIKEAIGNKSHPPRHQAMFSSSSKSLFEDALVKEQCPYVFSLPAPAISDGNLSL